MTAEKRAKQTDRLAAALKENLKRRKLQARAKAKAGEALTTQSSGTAPQADLDGGLETNPKARKRI